jgi:hypothetical protein
MIITPAIRRNFFITLFLAIGVLAVGGFLFGNSEVGFYVVPGVAFFGGLGLLIALNDRELRHQERSDGTTPS